MAYDDFRSKGIAIIGNPPEKKTTADTLIRLILSSILSVVLTVGSFPLPVKAVDKAVDTGENSIDIQLAYILVDELAKTLVIEKVESEYQKKQEAQRLSALAKKTQPRANLTVNSGTSGDNYGTAVKLYADNTNNCVQWFKKQTGITRTLGAGGRSGINSQTPAVGAGAVLKNRPHIGLIVQVKANSVVLHESNYVKNWIVQREVPLSMVMGYVN